MERKPDYRSVIHEAPVLPEWVEAELLTASRKLITGARNAGVWAEDCATLAAFLDNPEDYLHQLEAGHHRSTDEKDTEESDKEIDKGEEAVENVFCPTGPGRGVDSTCSPE